MSSLPASPPARRPALPSHALARCAGIAALTALVSACAQQSASDYYNPPRESSITDAQSQYQDSRGRSAVRAPSQLQIELRPDPPAGQTSPAAGVSAASPNPAKRAATEAAGGTSDGAAGSAAPAPDGASAPGAQGEAAPINTMAARVIPEPLTFLGTVPCFTPGLRCTAQRVSLTLSPNGRWRARTTALDGGKPLAEQGCWRGIPERPARVIVQEADGTTRAELLMVANNVLQVRSVGGVQPNLDYRLTRQPDLDGIDELSQAAPPRCD